MPTSDASHYHTIVIGVGSMGSAACFHLSQRNQKVLGLEQFSSPHERGAHGAHTRIIRKAYFEHPDYVPLLEKAYANWHLIEQLSGEQLYVPTGLLYAGPPGNDLLQRIREAAQQYQISLEEWDSAELKQRVPQFTLPANSEIMFEPEAGFLYPDKAIEVMIALSIRAGATIRQQCPVLGWEADELGVKVFTEHETFTADKLIITAGPWAGSMIAGAQQHLQITQQTLAWYTPPADVPQNAQQFPCWLIAEEGVPGAYYGFPALPNHGPNGWKIAHHHAGKPTHPDETNRTINEKELATLGKFMQQYLGVADDALITTKTCLYSNSPDEHFVIDLLPGYHQRVSVAWGFSGHGFKFTSVVGEILADLSMYGKTPLPAQLLQADRLSMI
jgi:sarcosine oxidase